MLFFVGVVLVYVRARARNMTPLVFMSSRLDRGHFSAYRLH